MARSLGWLPHHAVLWPLPGGYYQEMPSVQQSCPIGYWRGPWGHCRNTPYHGPLPGGGYKP